MADVDTIEVLDNLQFEHLNTADVWTIDGEGPSYEAVKTYLVMLPATALAARVLFNNNYDLSASRVHARVRCNKVTAINAAGITKSQNTQPLEWTAVAAQAFLSTSEIDVSAAFEASLHIDCAISAATAHDGTEIIVQVRKEGALDEWSDLCRFVGPAGTACKVDVASTAAAGQKVIPVTNPTAGNFSHIGKFIFIEDATIANCEIAYLTACGADS